MRARWLIAVVAAALLLAACGGGDDGSIESTGDDSEDMQMDGDTGSMGGDDEIDFGRPGDPTDADREIRIEAFDSFEFDPARVEVEEGEVVTFVVANDGQIVHEFTLGGEDFQMAHEEEMSMEGMMEDEPYSVSLDPGETKRLTWIFSKPGEVLYGCHEPGHYDGGMVGVITVS